MIRKLIKDERGSSSILVIILMVVLLVFGLAVLTTSLSNLRLSEKKRNWLDDYYSVEAKAWYRIAVVDQLLIESAEEANSMVRSGDYMDIYMLDEATNLDELYGVFAYVYQDIAQTTLRNYIESDPTSVLMMSYDNAIKVNGGYEIPTTTLTFNVASDESDYPKHIEVTLDILIPTESNTEENLVMMKRYDIKGFVEWQPPFEYDSGIDFGDPFEEEGIIDGENPFEEIPDEGNPFENLN